MSAHVFGAESMECPRADVLAFAQLRSLSLVVAHSQRKQDWEEDDDSPYPIFPGIHGLPILLGSMPSLAHLGLRMPDDPEFPSYFYNYEDVFSKGTQWHKLGSISLQNLAIRPKQFMDLVTKRMPNLRRLTLAKLDLLEGKWECVFQALSEMDPPPILEFIYEEDNQMTYREGESEVNSLWQPDCPSSFFKDLGSYVTNGGGRHPCLPDGQPDSAAAHLFRLDTA